MPDVDGYQRKKIAEGGEAEKECAAIEAELPALRASYEQYFLGLERQPPSDTRRELKKRLNQLKGAFIRQTGTKFRVGSLYQKFLTYERLWDRTLQEMENGTNRRDLFRARRKAQQRAKPGQKPAPSSNDDFDVDEAPLAPSAPAPVAASKPSPPAPLGTGARPQADGNSMTDEKVRAIFNAYVSAKKRCNEDVSKLTFDAVAANLRKQVPALMQQHQAKAIEFKIVIKDGKAILKAVPKT